VGFENVSSLLSAISPKFAREININAREGFTKDGIPASVIEEVVSATLRVNYGQYLDVHKFVGR